MKGIVFTEFLEMVEKEFGLEILDQIITESQVKSKGVYTSVGNYDHTELFYLVLKLSECTNTSVSKLFNTFGMCMFQTFAEKYGSLFGDVRNSFEFLSRVDDHIHVEVEKLYPDAELPKLEVLNQSVNSIEMIYSSKRKLSEFATGLILGCGKHFNTELDIKKEDLSNGKGTKVKFYVTEA